MIQDYLVSRILERNADHAVKTSEKPFSRGTMDSPGHSRPSVLCCSVLLRSALYRIPDSVSQLAAIPYTNGSGRSLEQRLASPHPLSWQFPSRPARHRPIKDSRTVRSSMAVCPSRFLVNIRSDNFKKKVQEVREAGVEPANACANRS